MYGDITARICQELRQMEVQAKDEGCKISGCLGEGILYAADSAGCSQELCSGDGGSVYHAEVSREFLRRSGEAPFCLGSAYLMPRCHEVRFLARGSVSSGDRLGQECSSYRWPFGGVAVITPFNFPLEIPVLQLMGALYMGNRPILHVDHRVCCAWTDP